MRKIVFGLVSVFSILMISACGNTQIQSDNEINPSITYENKTEESSIVIDGHFEVSEELTTEQEEEHIGDNKALQNDDAASKSEETKKEKTSVDVIINEEDETSTLEENANVSSGGNKGFIIIGDSHTVITEGYGYNKLGSAVKGVTPGENLFFVHTSMDPVMGTFDWLAGDGTDRIKGLMDNHSEIDNWSIISMHGTSMCATEDIEDKYIDLYKKWMNKTFKGAGVYLVSIPPLDEAKWVENHPELPARFNSDIEDFNNTLKKKFSKNYYDYYDWMNKNGVFLDEIHYTGETYVKMFDQIIGDIINR